MTSATATTMAQEARKYQKSSADRTAMVLEGRVVTEDRKPLSGVNIEGPQGRYATTDALGYFKIPANLGDEIIIRRSDFETVYYRIRSYDDLEIQVTDADEQKENLKALSYETLLDSAQVYLKKDPQKTADFLIASLSNNAEVLSDAKKARVYEKLGDLYAFNKQHDLAISNFKEAIKAVSTNSRQLKLANSYLENGNYQEALTAVNALITKRNSLTSDENITAFTLLGKAYDKTNDLEKALSNYNIALELAQNNNKTSLIPDLNTSIADVYNRSGNVVLADTYYNTAIKESANVSVASNVVNQSRTADFYRSNQQYDKEIALRKKNIELLENDDEVPLAPVSESNDEDEFELAAIVVEETVVAMDDTSTAGASPKDFINPAMNDLGLSKQKEQLKIAEAYSAKNDFTAAIASFTDSYNEATKKEDLATKKEAARNLAILYRKEGNTSKALDYNTIYIETAEQFYKQKDEEIAFNTRKAQELLNKQTRVLSLEKDRELTANKLALAQTEQQLATQINTRQRWIIYALVLLSLLLISLAYFMWRTNKQQRINNHLLALKSLRSQMNPHFIFNALNSVNSYIARNDERAANKYLADFSKLMRSVLENSELDFIPLAKEIELLQLYVKLEHERFQDKFDYDITIDPSLENASIEVPPMLLQPIIENAVWHGLRYKDEKGFLNIAFAKANNTLTVTITDNGIGRDKSKAIKTTHQKKRSSKGLGNIDNRVALLNELHDAEITVNVSDAGMTPDVGTKVVVTIKN